MRAIVSMTSYPKRIQYVAKVIKSIINQSRKPDEIHLWLAKEEFENTKIPEDLQELIDNKSVNLHWLEKNTYLHKRHEIFKYTSNDDLVFFFDDDIIYKETLIEDVMKRSEELGNKTIINYNKFWRHRYKKKHIEYMNEKVFNKEYTYYMWCGHSMIPSSVYPKFLLEDKYVKKRDMLSPVSEECWLQPWLVWQNIPIECMDFKWGKEVAHGVKKQGLCSWYYKLDDNRLSYKDKCLNAVLKEFPFIYDKYKMYFNYDSENTKARHSNYWAKRREEHRQHVIISKGIHPTRKTNMGIRQKHR